MGPSLVPLLLPPFEEVKQGVPVVGGGDLLSAAEEPPGPRVLGDALKLRRHLVGKLEEFQGIDFDERQDEWMGSRPVTPDGLPLVGATQAPNVYVAGGHGMWGIVLGPATGKLLAEQITTGRIHPAIEPFDPLR